VAGLLQAAAYTMLVYLTKVPAAEVALSSPHGGALIIANFVSPRQQNICSNLPAGVCACAFGPFLSPSLYGPAFGPSVACCRSASTSTARTTPQSPSAVCTTTEHPQHDWLAVFLPGISSLVMGHYCQALASGRTALQGCGLATWRGSRGRPRRPAQLCNVSIRLALRTPAASHIGSARPFSSVCSSQLRGPVHLQGLCKLFYAVSFLPNR
jgi:hypothetical protein